MNYSYKTATMSLEAGLPTTFVNYIQKASRQAPCDSGGDKKKNPVLFTKDRTPI